ncbi:MAG: histidine kinase dimerization/phospho-acceptor domain-containing protein [Pseudomonadota bacterium]|nr:histidine kinase dimerization/phospho-acceptor domain-containing protein [Pseudomonadota bacterium]
MPIAPPARQDSEARSILTGEFIDRAAEASFRRATYDTFCKQQRILVWIILLAAGPIIVADHLLLRGTAMPDLFLPQRVIHFIIPLLWLRAIRGGATTETIDRWALTYALYLTAETFYLMTLYRADYQMILPRVILFILAGNIFLDIAAAYRLTYNVAIFAATTVGLAVIFPIAMDERVLAFVILVVAVGIGVVAGGWLSVLRRGEYLHARTLERANLALIEERRRAEEASAARSVFLANVSHELRTPLNAVIGFSEILRTEMFGPVGNARYKGYADDISSSGTRLLALIDDLLHLSRIEGGEANMVAEWIDVDAALAEWVGAFAPQASARGQTLDLAPLPPGLAVRFDRQALRHAFTGLLSNATGFTQRGGTITVGFDTGSGGVSSALYVRDNGPGIAPETIERLHRPFEQFDAHTARGSGGWGLGLPLVHGLALANGARLDISSPTGRGTEARIAFAPEAVRWENSAA